MDGDGDIDVAAYGWKPRLNWFENDGHGNFTKHDCDVENFNYESIIGIADYDGDGRQDVWLEGREHDAQSNERNRYLVAKGQEGGGFDSPMLVAETPYHSDSGGDTQVADLNGDGFIDILGTKYVFLGTSTGSFHTPSPIHPDVYFNIWQDIIHDYDSDGDLDLLSGHSYCENTGGGQFAAPKKLFDLPAGLDFDGFGILHPDTIGTPPKLVVLASNADMTGQKLFLYERQSDGTALMVEEFNLPHGEGQTSWQWCFVRPDQSSTRTYLSCWPDVGISQLHELKYGEAGFVLKLLNTHQDITSFDHSGEADLNGDGIKDLVVVIPWHSYTYSSATDHILWYPGKVDGSFQATPATVVPAVYERQLQIADDFDGDGDVDLMFGLSSPLGSRSDVSQNAVWSNHGNGIDFDKKTFAIPGLIKSVLGVEDFVTQPIKDGERPTGFPFVLPQGKKDFIIRSDFSYHGATPGAANVYLLVQNSLGDFHVKLVMSGVSDSIIYYKDWDGDGARDLIFIGPDGALSWSKRTDYKFGARQQIMSFPSNPIDSLQTKDFALLDMDRDGDLDIYGRGSLFGPDSSYWAERGADSEILSIRKLHTPLDLLYFDADGDAIKESTARIGNSGGINPMVDFHFENADLGAIYYNKTGLFDFDADDDFDLLISAPTFNIHGFQRLIWHENQGGGPSINDATSVEFAGIELSYRDQFAQKDMDGDGTKDFLVVSRDTALVEWFKITNRNGPQAFKDWMAGQSLTGSTAGPKSDWDMDGRTNWEEFVFGTQAKVHDSGYGREPHIEKTATGMNFTYTRRKSGAGLHLNYGMQRSKKLNGDWEPWNPEVTPAATVSDYEDIHIPINSGENAEFFRVKLPDVPK